MEECESLSTQAVSGLVEAGARMPVYFLCHGAGPWPRVPEMHGWHALMAEGLRNIPRQLVRRPRAVLRCPPTGRCRFSPGRVLPILACMTTEAFCRTPIACITVRLARLSWQAGCSSCWRRLERGCGLTTSEARPRPFITICLASAPWGGRLPSCLTIRLVGQLGSGPRRAYGPSAGGASAVADGDGRPSRSWPAAFTLKRPSWTRPRCPVIAFRPGSSSELRLFLLVQWPIQKLFPVIVNRVGGRLKIG